MVYMNNASYKFLFGLLVSILFLSPIADAVSPATVNLSTAGNFAVLSKVAVTDVPTSNITGDLGVSPASGTTIGVTCAEVNGTIYSVDAAGPLPCRVTNSTLLGLAIGDMGTAYTNASSRLNGTGDPDYLNEGAGTLTGLTLYTGIHKWTGGVTIPTDLFLDCQGDPNAVFIFQIAGTLDIASAKSVNLTNGCQPSNIFWAVAGATSLGTTSVFKGTILSGATSDITLLTGARLDGRALSDGQVILQSNTVVLPVNVVDAAPPTVTLNTQNNSWTSSNQSGLNFTFVDAISATANCSLFIDGALYNASSIAANNTPTLITPNATLSEGAHSWHVNCTDLSNNTGTSVARIINVDTIAPVTSLATPANGTWSTNVTPAFTFNYTDASANASCTLFVGGAARGTNGSVSNSTDTAIIANTTLSQGSNSWYVNCTDLAGNVGNSTVRAVLVDSIYPTAAINSVNGMSDGYGTGNATLSINFTANDTNIANWTLSVYDSAWVLLQNWTETTSNISAVETYAASANGTYHANLTVIDNAASANTTTFTVYVDQTAPVINSSSVVNVTGSTASLSANASDAYSGINNCTYSGAGNGNLTLSGGLYAASLSGLAASTNYTVNVTCFDKAGYSASSFTNFTTASGVIRAAVNLGTAGNFIALAKTGISTTGTTSIVGDIGVSPAAASYITGFGLIADSSNRFSTSSLINGKVYAADYSPPTPSVMTTAISDMETAYTDAAGRTLPDYTELGSGNIGGMTLAPGLYKWSTGVTIPTDVTLAGNSSAVWIFQIAQTLDISSAKRVLLSGGAQAKNIFWQVAGQTTLGTTSVFNGNILDQTAIVLNTGATLNGRAMAQTAVTLDGSSVSLPDTTSLVVALNSPTLGFSTSNTSIVFNFTATDDSAATVNCSLFIDGALNQTNAATANNTATLFTVSGIAQGNHSWNMSCIDAANRTGTSARRTFTVNTVNPSLIVSAVSNAVSSNVSFSANANGTGTAITYVSLNIYDNASALVSSLIYNTTSGINTAGCTVTNISRVACLANPFIGGGNFLLNVTVQDEVGLSNNSVQYFNLTTTAGNSTNIITTLANVAAAINGTGATGGMQLGGVNPVNITSDGLPVLGFDYNFTASPLDFGALNISNGTSSGASYLVVRGVNSTGAQIGAMTAYIYNASIAYDGICVQNLANPSIPSAACTGAGEFTLLCNGVADSHGITCTKSNGGTTLSISGLNSTAAIQYNTPVPVPAPSGSSGSNNNGGGSVGSGGSGTSTSSAQTSTYSVNIGGGRLCDVTIRREISSSNARSAVTTTLRNTGGSGCGMNDFAFTDTIPSGFAAMDEITFSPAYTARDGWAVTFAFPSFASGESKTLVYSVNKWVGPSKLAAFSVYSMSGRAEAVPEAAKPPAKPAEQGTAQNATVANPDQVVIPEVQSPQAASEQKGVLLPGSFYSDLIASLWWIPFAVLILLGGAYWYMARENEKKRSAKEGKKTAR